MKVQNIKNIKDLDNHLMDLSYRIKVKEISILYRYEKVKKFYKPVNLIQEGLRTLGLNTIELFKKLISK